MNKPTFSASFTAGSLFVYEFMALDYLLLEDHFFDLLTTEIEQNKILQIKSETARKRIVAEIKKRFQSVDRLFWAFFLQCAESEKRLALYYVCLKTYPLVLDFHFEVVLKRWRMLDRELTSQDIQLRMDELASENDYVSQWTKATHEKLVQVFLRMLREAQLLNHTTLVKPSITRSTFWGYFIQQTDTWFLDACFLTQSEKEMLL
ncbi:MAG: BrxA family protein [Spirosomataceae bacterium]